LGVRVPTAATRRYAKAVFELAQEQGQVEEWARRLRTVSDVLADPQVERVVGNPTITRERRRQAVAAVLGDRTDAQGVNLAKLLVESNRADLAGQVVEEYQLLVDEAAGRVRALATTAVELTQAEQQTLARGLSTSLGKEVRLESRVEPAIIGGLVVRVGDRVIDASVATRLQRLRQHLAGV
jgi:F-type H+-transporting ATPase subunit delta